MENDCIFTWMKKYIFIYIRIYLYVYYSIYELIYIHSCHKSIFFLKNSTEKSNYFIFQRHLINPGEWKSYRTDPDFGIIKELLVHASFFIHFSWMWGWISLIKVFTKYFEMFSKAPVRGKSVLLKFPANKLQLALHFFDMDLIELPKKTLWNCKLKSAK